MQQRSQNFRDENDNDGWNVCKSKKVPSDKLGQLKQQQQQQQQQPQPSLVVDAIQQAKKSRKDSESQVAEKKIEENQFIVVEKHKRPESQQYYESELPNPKMKDSLQQSQYNSTTTTTTTTTTTGMTPTEKFKQFRERLNDQTKRDYYFDRQFFKIHNCPQINGLDSKLIEDLSDENSSIYQKTRNIILSYLNYNGGIIFFGLSSIYRDGLPHMEVRGFDITLQNRKYYDTIHSAINIISSRIYPKSFKIDVSIMKVQKDTHRKTVPINKYIARIVVQQGADLQNLYVYRETANSPEFIAAKYSKKDSSFVTIKGTGVGNVLELKLQLAKVKDLTIKHTDDFMDRKDSFSYLKGKFSMASEDQDYSDEESFDSSIDEDEEEPLSDQSEDQGSSQDRDSVYQHKKQQSEYQESSSSTNNQNNSQIPSTLDVSSADVGGWNAEIPIDTKVQKISVPSQSTKSQNPSDSKMNDSALNKPTQKQDNEKTLKPNNIHGRDSSNGSSNMTNEHASNFNLIQGQQELDQTQKQDQFIHRQEYQQGSYLQSDLLPQFLNTELLNDCNENNQINHQPQNSLEQQTIVNHLLTNQFNQYPGNSNQIGNQNSLIQGYHNIQQQSIGQQIQYQQGFQRISSPHTSWSGSVYQPNNHNITPVSQTFQHLQGLSDLQLKDLQRHLENQVKSYQDILTFAHIEQNKRISQISRGISNGLLNQKPYYNGSVGQLLHQNNFSK